MILLEEGEQGRIVQSDRHCFVKQWEVWFRTHRGLHKTLRDALADAEAIGMPAEMIRPITVAVGEDGTYEEVFR